MRMLKIQVKEFPPPLQKQIYMPKLVKIRKERKEKQILMYEEEDQKKLTVYSYSLFALSLPSNQGQHEI